MTKFTKEDRVSAKNDFKALLVSSEISLIKWNFPIFIYILLLSTTSVSPLTQVAGGLFGLVLALFVWAVYFKWSDVHSNPTLEGKEKLARTLSFRDIISEVGSVKLFGSYLLGMLVKAMYIYALVFIPIAILTVAFMSVLPERIGSSAALGMGFVISLVMALLIVAPIAIYASYQMFPYMFLLRDKLKKGEPVNYFGLIKESINTIKGHKFSLFVTELSFFGWYFLGFALGGSLSAVLLGQNVSNVGTAGIIGVIYAMLMSIVLTYQISVESAFWNKIKP